MTDFVPSAMWGARLELLRRSPVFGYALAPTMSGLALWARFQIGPGLTGYPFITFFPAVILTTFFGGLGPGILAGILCGAASYYYFIHPIGDWGLIWPDGYIAMGFYILIVAIDIVLIEAMNRALRSLREEQSLTERLSVRHAVLFQELQHRVANNMALLGAVLRLQLRRVRAGESDPDTALSEAIERIDMMSRVHRRFYEPATAERPVGDLLHELCTELSTLSGEIKSSCEVAAEPLILDLPRMLPLALLVTEVVINSVKHATPGRLLNLRLEIRRENGEWVLDLADDGPGMSDAAGEGLGSRIMKNLAEQIDAKLDILRGHGPADRPGTLVRIRFAA